MDPNMHCITRITLTAVGESRIAKNKLYAYSPGPMVILRNSRRKSKLFSPAQMLLGIVRSYRYSGSPKPDFGGDIGYASEQYLGRQLDG